MSEFDQKFIEMELLVVLFIVVLKIKIECLKVIVHLHLYLSMCLLQAFEIGLNHSLYRTASSPKNCLLCS